MDTKQEFDTAAGVAQVAEEFSRMIRELLPGYRALYRNLRRSETVQ